MLNFEKAVGNTNKMLAYSKEFVEWAIQRMLDYAIVYDSKTSIAESCVDAEDIKKIFEGDEFGIYENVFAGLKFQLCYNCFGEVWFDFSEDTDKKSTIYRLVKECLEKNKFTAEDIDNNIFVYDMHSNQKR